MAYRVMFLMALASFVFLTASWADETPKLPSHKASVVLPLLEQLSIKDTSYFSKSPDSVLSQLSKILGNADFGSANVGHAEFCYQLDDKTGVWVQFLSPDHNLRIMELKSITVKTSESKVVKTIYPKSAH